MVLPALLFLMVWLFFSNGVYKSTFQISLPIQLSSSNTSVVSKPVSTRASTNE
ncbi:phosphate ABC transporter permease family protein [Sinomicrobium weinanense]|uniref:Phosphate ABC transporter permease family protein n=1 Tax=Sinomicrobium weinanense TaxID=2842200 RepID=A0A926Q1X4_9FLAO|nr:phosphate ABC transporter permease family protein [Sinomicrobium weinanense]MBU3122011.1 phosphate ABC transporter permease family protein [Sinomicrobium weinanense]